MTSSKRALTYLDELVNREDTRLDMIRLWLRSHGLRRPVDQALFDDYDGVEKTLVHA